MISKCLTLLFWTSLASVGYSHDPEDRYIYINPTNILEFHETGVVSQNNKYLWEPPTIVVGFGELYPATLETVPFFPLQQPAWKSTKYDAIITQYGVLVKTPSLVVLIGGKEIETNSWSKQLIHFNTETNAVVYSGNVAPFSCLDCPGVYVQHTNSIVVIGGVTETQSTVNHVWQYALSTGEFIRLPNLPVSLTAANAISLSSNRSIYVFGGNRQGTLPNTDVLKFNGNSWSIDSALSFAPIGTCLVEVVWNQVPHIMLVGGRINSTPQGSMTTLYLYNTVTKYMSTIPLTKPLNLDSVQCIFNGLSLFVIGGIRIDPDNVRRYSRAAFEYRFSSDMKIISETQLPDSSVWHARGVAFLK